MRKPWNSTAGKSHHPAAGALAGSHQETIAARLIRQNHMDNLAMPHDWTKERLERLCLLWNCDIEIIAAMLNCRVHDLEPTDGKGDLASIPGVVFRKKRMSGTVALMLTMMERQAHERKGCPCSPTPTGSSAGARPFHAVHPSRWMSAAKRELLALKAAEAQKRIELGLPPLGDLAAVARKQRKAKKLYGVQTWTGDCAA